MFQQIIFLLCCFIYVSADEVYNAVWVNPAQRYNIIDLKVEKNYAVVQIIFDKCQFDSIDHVSNILDDYLVNNKTINKWNEMYILQDECEHLSHNYNKNIYFSNGSKISKTVDGRGIFWSFCIGKNICNDILLRSQILLRMIKEQIGTCVCNAQVLKHTQVNSFPMVETLWISGRSLE